MNEKALMQPGANTFYHGDCLFVLTHDIPAESVDLIYLDPPFFTGKVQKGKWQPGAMEVSFEDSRRFWKEKGISELAPEWMKHIAIKRPDFASYLYYMMERLQACHKALKKTGSIYLHCDYRASHYLKMVMDEIFGPDRFMNEIIWYYKTGGVSKRWLGRKHDTILLYSKGETHKFKPQKEKSYLTHKYGFSNIQMHQDERGYYRWVTMRDVWDIPALRGNQPETTGYPTQKPEELLRRIIELSSDENDLVLDPFCGCGTTVIVASKLNRRFIGIDIDTSDRKKGQLPTAFQVIKNRSHELFSQSRYVSRDLKEVLEMNAKEFEDWVNEFYGATKPSPDKGVDGITIDGIPIQVKTSRVGYKFLSQFITDAKYHPNVPKPVQKVVLVSQTGFDNGARQRKFAVETAEGIEVQLTTPEEILRL